MRASSKRPRVETSGVAPPHPSFISDTTAEESVDPAAAAIATTATPPPSNSNDLDIRRILETIITIQATHD